MLLIKRFILVSIPKIVLYFLLFHLLTGCAGMTIKDYEPVSPDEAAIQETLFSFQNGWNQQKKDSLLLLLDDDFIIWEGDEKERNILLTKARFGFYIRDLWRRIRFVNMGKPDFWFDGSKATVFLPISMDGRNVRTKFRLIKKNDKWLLTDWEI